jgi:hypothetical protein
VYALNFFFFIEEVARTEHVDGIAEVLSESINQSINLSLCITLTIHFFFVLPRCRSRRKCR